jgi:polyphenol oxidase
LINAIHSTHLKNAAGVSHAFCGRNGGVSTGVFASLNCGPGSGDDPAAVAENRVRALKTVSASHVNTLYQIHSAQAVIATAPWTRETAPQADGMATNVKGLALGILTADCAPVLFADPKAGVIGAAHAGWKGAFAGVIEATVEKMLVLGARSEDTLAFIGPTISQVNYEVGAEFFDRFVEVDPKDIEFFEPALRPARWEFDLVGYVLKRISSTGIEVCGDVGCCTYARESEFFSFRRATHRGEADYGRNLSLIVLT